MLFRSIPVAPISSLATLAQAAYIKYRAENVLAAIDARKSEKMLDYYIQTTGIVYNNGFIKKDNHY